MYSGNFVENISSSIFLTLCGISQLRMYVHCALSPEAIYSLHPWRLQIAHFGNFFSAVKKGYQPFVLSLVVILRALRKFLPCFRSERGDAIFAFLHRQPGNVFFFFFSSLMNSVLAFSRIFLARPVFRTTG